MQGQRKDKVADQLAHLAAEFLGRESNRQSLITVTCADISPDMRRATIYFVVLPEGAEKDALDFAKRKRSEFKTFVKEHTNLRVIPFFDFAIDVGEKHRQHLDEISNTM